jgi:hypothetical protein
MLSINYQSKDKQPSVLRFVPNQPEAKDFDYTKTKTHFEFEIKAGQDAEALRILADKVEKYLHDDVVCLKIENGDNTDLYAFLEGVFLPKSLCQNPLAKHKFKNCSTLQKQFTKPAI